MISDDRDPVDLLAEEFVERLRRGEHPSVSDYAAAHPDHADELREVLPAVAQMEMLKRFRMPSVATAPSLPDRLGDFRIVRELGRGGMGVVFEAVQESLGRPVALKVLARHAQLDPTRRERFVREAQAAARLHHTNIVPVFGVGEHDGLPYYVMQLIPGHGLHAIVRQWRNRSGELAHAETLVKPDTSPTSGLAQELPEPAEVGPRYGDWRFVAEVGRQAADALHYAHKQGVLHRDVKPGNLILDGDIVWVTDFGLAKLVNTDGLTATGDILGTLQYVSPETLHGGADARSDVYGLGATLYELLTLHPPYAADSPAQLIKQVSDGAPPPPRSLNPDIPRDLETIVLTAMAREPGARYASAREMARDLEAFLDDQPIRARRTTLVERAWRWCRRNPAVASLAGSTAAAVVLAAVAGWAGYARTQDALGSEADRRKEAERAKADADRATAEAKALTERLQANLDLSLDTFNKVFVAAGGPARPVFLLHLPPLPDWPPRMGGPPGGPGRKDGFPPGGGPGGSGGHIPPGGNDGGPNRTVTGPTADATDKAAILEAVLDFYDKLAAQTPPNTALRFEAAKASCRVCEAQQWLKNPEKATAAFRRAVTLLEPLVAANPTKDEMRTELVMLYLNAPADAYPTDPDAPFQRASELAEGYPRLTGSVQFRIGLTKFQTDDRAGALEAYRAAVDAFEAAPAPRAPHEAYEAAAARLWVAHLSDDSTEARELLETAVAVLKPFAETAAEPHRRFCRELLSRTYAMLASTYKRLGDPRESDARRLAIEYSVPLGGFGGRPGGPGGGWPGGFGPGGGWPGGWQEPGGPKKDGGGPGPKKGGGKN